jgi:putative chitinase
MRAEEFIPKEYLFIEQYEDLDEDWRTKLAGLALGTGVAMGGAQAKAPTTMIPQSDSNVIVQKISPGDTVYSIARKFGISPEEIARFNNLDKDFTIKAGDTLSIPKKITPRSSRSATATPSRSNTRIDTSRTLTGTFHEAVLTKEARSAGINDPVELAALLSQCAHESNNFRSLVEYGGRLDFRKYDIKFNPRKARQLGNNVPGDGAKYKGRGYIQLTGKYNYRRAGNALGIDLVNNPELAENPEIAAKIAVWFWKQRVQPNVDNFNDVRAVTRPINPGLRHLDKRIETFSDFKQFKTAMR